MKALSTIEILEKMTKCCTAYFKFIFFHQTFNNIMKSFQMAWTKHTSSAKMFINRPYKQFTYQIPLFHDGMDRCKYTMFQPTSYKILYIFHVKDITL